MKDGELFRSASFSFEMSGFGRGRGGRGQALLEALQQPVRKPGTSEAAKEGPARVSGAVDG